MPTDTIAGVVDSGWFSARLQQLMGALQIDARTVPIFLTDNVMLYSGNYLGCCTIGCCTTGWREIAQFESLRHHLISQAAAVINNFQFSLGVPLRFRWLQM